MMSKLIGPFRIILPLIVIMMILCSKSFVRAFTASNPQRLLTIRNGFNSFISSKEIFSSSSYHSMMIVRQQQQQQYNQHRSFILKGSSTKDTTSSTVDTVSQEGKQKKSSSKIIQRRILSGVQPTGSLHLGNYLGAIRQWVEFQNNPDLMVQVMGQGEISNNNEKENDEKEVSDDKNEVHIQTENYFCVVDLHAITMPHEPAALYESTLSSAAFYLAAGIDPKKSKVFIQSHVTEHTELTWLLNCMTPMNWLERMIQYKEKSKKTDSVGVGLFSYPVLMAADIILYQTTHVPVGEDQRQHLELTRDIVRRFHDIFCKGNAYKKRCKEAGVPSRPAFIEPNAIIMPDTGRIMSLTDGTSKMSKSDPSDASRINVLDPPDTIRNKIKRCKTDEYRGIEWNNPERPEATNLLNIYLAVSGKKREEITNEVKDMTWGEFKPILANAIIDYLEPIQKRYYEIRNDDEYLRSVLADGASAARAVASQTLKSARIAMGFYLPSSATATSK